MWEVAVWRACKFFGCLPSQLEQEDTLTLLRVLRIDLWAQEEEAKKMEREASRRRGARGH